MSRIKKIFILANLVLLIGYINWAIAVKEETLMEGQLVLLELAPVDPRSLTQGDYMRLNYKISQLTGPKNIKKRGYCILRIDTAGVAQRIRFQENISPLSAGEIAVKYYSNGTERFPQIRIGAESYFFEEGQRKRFEQAKFAGLKVDAQGNTVLIGLYSDNHKRL